MFNIENAMENVYIYRYLSIAFQLMGYINITFLQRDICESSIQLQMDLQITFIIHYPNNGFQFQNLLPMSLPQQSAIW